MDYRRIIILISLLLMVGRVHGQSFLTSSEGTFFSIDSGTVVKLHETSLINRGQLIAPKARLYMAADENNLVIRGQSFNLGHLIIDAPDQQVDLLTSLTVHEEVRIKKGILDLHASDITLTEKRARLVGENNENRVTASEGGELIKLTNLNRPSGTKPGNLGLEISTYDNLGATEVRRGHGTASVSTGESISRYYRIIATNAPNTEVQLKFTYLSAEGAQYNEQLQAWKKTENRWASMLTNDYSPSGQMPKWVQTSDFELAEKYTLASQEPVSEDLSSIPTAFTPNGDGVNDTFVIPWIQYHPEARVSIYNRWGERVYSATNYTQSEWDGSFKGDILAPSSFYYIIELANGQPPIKGNISIVR